MTRVHPLPPDPGGQDHTSTTPVREDHAHAQRHVQAGLAHEEEEHEDGPLMRAFEQARPWLLTPNTVNRWLFFCAFWGCVIGGGTYLFIWGEPATDTWLDCMAVHDMWQPGISAAVDATGSSSTCHRPDITTKRSSSLPSADKRSAYT